ncbi:Macrophage colony-stimulating factor 1 [Dissostichus eleginoides]|uniref:Macrophage colony-stimulating factor 1 n=1 Tax=Dissostichus eleginoides TaxID=100907 RepID=A0AAD9BBT5_DISEL|nr:Macrophage colony-stimulating factor 1 [Dissostichus eleginoides]
MGATWRFALLLCMVLMVSRSLANEDTEHATGSDAGTPRAPGTRRTPVMGLEKRTVVMERVDTEESPSLLYPS